ncbi:DUF4382 domain-containing protein [Gaetbulibacter aquiaggeris]|uniref:DUF4382 domain-containing protein n=1 Tax=Gaetbulibacter aquiaggeris TaxID=1735373 RepID=A0ABW7MPK2_9FLAO
MKYFFVTLLLIAVTSCTNDTAEPKGTLSVKLSDAPMHYNQFMSASVTIDKIEIGSTAHVNSMINIMNTPMSYNLLELINGITATMANAEISVGNYDLMRLYISSTEMVMTNGDLYTYNMDQEGYSGNGMMQGGMMLNSSNRSIDITLNNSLTISEGGMTEFLLDIDVNESFILEGVNYTGSGPNMMMSMSGFTFMPTIRFVDMSTSGTIHGNVQDTVENLPNATISLLHNGTLYTTTHSDGNGNYAFIGIPQGMYTIKVELDGYIMNPAGNEQNMHELNMMSNATISVNFNMMT